MTAQRQATWRRAALASIGVAAAAGLLSASEGVLVEPRRLVRRQYAVPFAGLPAALDGLSILHLSDFHYTPRNGWLRTRLRDMVGETAASPPDIIALTGDFVEWDEDAPAIATLLAQLRARLGTFAVLGNHDYGNAVDPPDQEERRLFNRLADTLGAPLSHYQGRPTKAGGNCAAAIVRALEDVGITVLRNAAVAQQTVAGRFWIGGVDEPHQRRADPRLVFAGIPANEPVLLLAHSPEVLECPLPRPAGLILAGHTHGGQIRLPFLRPLVTHTRIPLPAYRGLIGTAGGPMHISAGIGATIPIRFRCPPESTTLTLKAIATPTATPGGACSRARRETGAVAHPVAE